MMFPRHFESHMRKFLVGSGNEKGYPVVSNRFLEWRHQCVKVFHASFEDLESVLTLHPGDQNLLLQYRGIHQDRLLNFHHYERCDHRESLIRALSLFHMEINKLLRQRYYREHPEEVV